MLKTRDELNQKINDLCKQNVGNTRKMQSILNALLNEHGIPISVSSDILTLRKYPDDESEFVLFCIMKQFDDTNKLISKYFTDKEINAFSHEQYVIHAISFPIEWPMIEIRPGQWIGKITAKEIMLLRDAQLIHYNENAQRTLKRMIVGDTEYYKISINKAAVNSIVESFQSESYIPNTITLNLPDDSDFVYSNGKLIINETSGFDILDGYHRYIAISRLVNSDRNFDYDMELRVVCFSDAKARQFIWQEDQKTKMSKVDSDTMNRNNFGMQVIQLIVEKDQFFESIFSRKNGIIDVAVFSQLVNLLYLDANKKYDRKTLVSVRDYLIGGLRRLWVNNDCIYDSRWSVRYTICVMYVLSLDICVEKIINKLYDITDDSMLNGRNVTATVLNRFKKAYREV